MTQSLIESIGGEVMIEKQSNTELKLWEAKVKGKSAAEDISLRAKEEAGVFLLEAQPLLKALGYEIYYSQSDQKITIEQKKGDNRPYEADYSIQNILKAIDKEKDDIVKTSLNIYQYAEPGNQEFKSSQLLVDKLKMYGFDVEYGLNGIKDGREVRLDTAFKATLKGRDKGPNIYIMLEYDALLMGHGCGHNLIAASGLAAAYGLSRLMPNLNGTLVVIGTPAEDGGVMRGKENLVNGGHFKDADIVFITHPWNNWTSYSYFLAVNGGLLTYKGLPSHAACCPEGGINALKAAYLTLNAIDALREHILPDSRIHAIIREGGMAPNIVPEKAQIDLRARSLNTSYVEDLMKKIENAAQGAAMAMGADVDIKWRGIQPASINVMTLNELVMDNISYFNISEISRDKKPIGSSDLSFVSHEVPTANLFFKISSAALHTHEFMQAAASDEGQEAMLIAGKVIALSAYQLFTNPEMVKIIRNEFDKIKLESKA